MLRQFVVDPRKIQHRRNLTNQMIVRHHSIEVERVEQLRLVLNAPTHHRTAPSMSRFKGITVGHGPQLTFATKSAQSGMR